MREISCSGFAEGVSAAGERPPASSHHHRSKFSVVLLIYSASLSGASAFTHYILIEKLIYARCLEGFPSGSDGKESACNAGDPGSIPGLEDPWRREWQPALVFLPGEFQGQRSLVGSQGVRHD